MGSGDVVPVALHAFARAEAVGKYAPSPDDQPDPKCFVQMREPLSAK